jgi:hypothetical protein
VESSALDVEVRQQPVQPSGQPPGRWADEGEHGWTRVVRTRNASTSTPNARANAIGLMMASSMLTKLAKTQNMIRAAAVTSREAWRVPWMIEGRAWRVRVHCSRMLETRKTS